MGQIHFSLPLAFFSLPLAFPSLVPYINASIRYEKKLYFHETMFRDRFTRITSHSNLIYMKNIFFQDKFTRITSKHSDLIYMKNVLYSKFQAIDWGQSQLICDRRGLYLSLHHKVLPLLDAIYFPHLTLHRHWESEIIVPSYAHNKPKEGFYMIFWVYASSFSKKNHVGLIL